MVLPSDGDFVAESASRRLFLRRGGDDNRTLFPWLIDGDRQFWRQSRLTGRLGFSYIHERCSGIARGLLPLMPSPTVPV